jgi:ribosome-associated translation inhibitor RaiA
LFRLKGVSPVSLAKLAVPIMILLAAGGCSRTGEITEGGISAVRSACPHIGIPAGTGDVTLFNPATSREATAIDVTAVLTNLQSTCDETGPQIQTNLTFDVLARRNQPGPARDVTLPYFITVVRGGTSVTAKRIGQVTVRFAEGQIRAQTTGQATASIDRAAATLPEEVRKRLTEKRKAGDQAAAMDPLADPAIRSAVLSSTFEALVGFQLTEDQLKYNVTR